MRIWPFGKITNKSLTDPADWLLELFGGLTTNSGVTVTVDTGLQNPAVNSCIKVIAETCASLKVRVVEIDADGNETAVLDHPALAVLRTPNEWSSGFDLIRWLVADALCRDAGGLAFVNWVNGKPVEIIRYRPGVIQADYTQQTGEPIFRVSGLVQPLQNIISVRGPFEQCALTHAREAIGVAQIMERHAAKFFSRASRPGGVIQTPKSIGDEGVKRMLGGWKAAQEGADNAGRTPVLWDGATFNALTFNSVDSQFLELRKFEAVEICRAFRVPPSMVYEMDRATWSNAEQAGREFLTYTIEPWLQALEGSLRRALFLPADRANFAIRFDRDDLTRADLGARATAYSSLIASRVINPNTARQWEGLDPYAGGETYANPNTGSSQPKPAGNSADPQNGDPNAA